MTATAPVQRLSMRSVGPRVRRVTDGLSTSQRVLVFFGLACAASALVHVLVWLFAGVPSLVGPVTWRKPIVFGASLAVLAWSLAWVLGHLRDTRALRVQAWSLVALLTAELALIDLQQWRGVASHFNNATTLDGVIFGMMGALIMGATVVVSWWTWRVWRSPRRDRPRERLTAARAGMLLLGAGNGIGIVLAVWGSTLVAAAGGDLTAAETLAGLKRAHAVGLHGLQVLPIASLALAFLPDEWSRVRAVRRAVAGYVLVLGWALWQAWPGDVALWPSALLLVTAAVIGMWTLGQATAGALATRLRFAPLQGAK